MKLPHWAEKALSTTQPKPPMWSTDGVVDSVAQERFLTYTNRFRTRWHELDSHQWKIPADKDREHYSFVILLAAAECARRLGKGAHPQKVVEARKDLLHIENQIAAAAVVLATLFKQRDQLQDDHSVASWRDWTLDPIDLWDAFEMCFAGPLGHRKPEFLGNAEIGEAILHQLNKARSTSRPVPEWPDLLELLGQRFEHGHSSEEFPNVTVGAGDTNKTLYSPWCNSMIRTLYNYEVLSFLTHNQLASLASVAFDAPPNDIHAKQIGALKAEQVRRLENR